MVQLLETISYPFQTSRWLKKFEYIYVAISIVGCIVVSFGLGCALYTWSRLEHSVVFKHRDEIDWSTVCVQPPILEPPSKQLNLQEASHFLTHAYRGQSAELLGGAVRIPTESFDDMNQDPLQEPRFEVFKDLHRYLEHQFPLASQHLEYINTYGLLYTIKGSKGGKPLVLMAHQDVVPVERSTVNQWTYEPFSGYFDGERVWGRGAMDTKSSLIAILEALEFLLQQQWTPERTVLVSFGFDEELDGSRGALALANTIRDRYDSQDSVYMIIDEGGGSLNLTNGLLLVAGVSEKGYTDVNIDVHTPGGHSSIPPDHTGIGILSIILTTLETEHASRQGYRLEQSDSTIDTYACISKLENDTTLLDVKALEAFLANDTERRSLIGTTQAIDIVNGGVKINALPELSSATINYRIDIRESVGEVTKRVEDVAKRTASDHGLGLIVNGKTVVKDKARGYIEITNGQSIEPAPTSPYTLDDEQWSLLVGSTNHALSTWFTHSEVTVAPILMTGNTDTWQYAGLTDHVYRYTVSVGFGANAHTVDEYTTIDGHVSTVVWYYELLQHF